MTLLSEIRKRFVHDLHQSFIDIDNKFTLLREIDDHILHEHITNIDEVLKIITEKLKIIFEAKYSAICFFSDKEFILSNYLNTGKSEKQIITSLLNCNAFSEQKPTFITDEENKQGLLLIPILVNTIFSSTKNNLFCVIALMNDSENMPADCDALNKQSSIEYASMISNQLSILLKNLLKRREEKFREKVLTSFFNNPLDYREAMNEILNAVCDFLPDWSPFRLDDKPLVQYLSFNNFNTPLIIEADNSLNIKKKNDVQEIYGIPVVIEDSICGLLIKTIKDDPHYSEVLRVNPKKEYSERYKSFRGEIIPKSEMVVSVWHNKSLIGVLNFEHDTENAFSEFHLAIAKLASSIIAQFFFTTKEKMNNFREKEAALLYSMHGFLVRLYSTYIHKTSQLSPVIYDKIDDLNYFLKSNSNLNDSEKKSLEDISDTLYRIFDKYANLSKMFLKNAPFYIQKAPINIYSAIDKAIKEFDPDKQEIKITKHFSNNNINVYASQLLQEHLYNLLNNSRSAVKDRIDKDDSMKEGQIDLYLEKKFCEDNKGVRTDGARIHVTIKDNGTGVPEELLHMIAKYNYTTKASSGTGYGLPAAIDYIRSMSGNLEYKNREDTKGFVVEFYLEEFNENYHKIENIPYE